MTEICMRPTPRKKRHFCNARDELLVKVPNLPVKVILRKKRDHQRHDPEGAVNQFKSGGAEFRQRMQPDSDLLLRSGVRGCRRGQRIEGSDR